MQIPLIANENCEREMQWVKKRVWSESERETTVSQKVKRWSEGELNLHWKGNGPTV